MALHHFEASAGGGGGGGGAGTFFAGESFANFSVGGGGGGGMQLFFPANLTDEPWDSERWVSWSSGGGSGCGACKPLDDGIAWMRPGACLLEVRCDRAHIFIGPFEERHSVRSGSLCRLWRPGLGSGRHRCLVGGSSSGPSRLVYACEELVAGVSAGRPEHRSLGHKPMGVERPDPAKEPRQRCYMSKAAPQRRLHNLRRASRAQWAVCCRMLGTGRSVAHHSVL